MPALLQRARRLGNLGWLRARDKRWKPPLLKAKNKYGWILKPLPGFHRKRQPIALPLEPKTERGPFIRQG